MISSMLLGASCSIGWSNQASMTQWTSHLWRWDHFTIESSIWWVSLYAPGLYVWFYCFTNSLRERPFLRQAGFISFDSLNFSFLPLRLKRQLFSFLLGYNQSRKFWLSKRFFGMFNPPILLFNHCLFRIHALQFLCLCSILRLLSSQLDYVLTR